MDPSRERDVEQAAVVTAPEPAQTQAPPALTGPLTAAKVAALQRYAGNAAVSRLLDDGNRPPAPPPAPPAARGPSILTDLATAGATEAEGAAGAGAGMEQAASGAAGGAADAARGAVANATGVAGASAATDAVASGAAAATAKAEQAATGGLAAETAALGAAAGAAEAVSSSAGDAKATASGASAGASAAVEQATSGAAAGGAGFAADTAAGARAGGANAAAGAAGGAGAIADTASSGAAGGTGAVADAASSRAAAGDAAGGAAAVAAPAASGAAATAGGAAPAAGATSGAAAGGGSAAAGAAQKTASGATAGEGAAGAAKGASAAAKGSAAAEGAAAPAAAASGGAAAAAPAAAPKVNKDPNADPGFQAMKGRSKTAAGGAKAHAPAKSGAAAAQAAAVPPTNDTSSQAAAAQVDEMSTKEPGAFDRAAFIAAVKQAIEASAPKNLEEADDFKDGGAGGVKEQVSGLAKDGKQASEKDIKDATTAPPDASKAKAKPVEPLRDEPVGQGTSTVGASGAMPPPVPAATTDLSSGPDAVDAKMAEAEVTDEQIKKSNEPTFNDALTARDQAAEHSAAAPADYRKDEKGVLGKAKGDAAGLEGAGLQQMHGARGQAFAQAVGSKQGAKTADEAKRAKVATDIQGIYDRTKTDVTKTLDGLDGKVDAAFSQGEGQARKAFESHVGARMDAYKDDRYSGLLGKGRWLKDKLMGMPSEVNTFYAEGKTRYLADMDGVIGRIADIVGAGLNAARARIAQGKGEIAKYVAQLPQDLKQVGQEAEEKLSGQFEQLESDVESKQGEMVDTLARKYVESRDALDARIDEMKAANRGLVDKAIDAVAGVVRTIIQLKNMLLGVLAKAADVIGAILQDPIGFLGNLINGIKAGLSRFVGNIANHLQQGLMGWLTGALGNAGLELPKTFDLAGIFSLILQILGLTYRNIRARVVKTVGEPVVQKLEQTVDIFKVLMTEGVGGLWRFIKDRVGDLEDTVIGGIKNFIIEKVIKAGITWLIAFMNPAAAFIKACKAIYDIVMFLIERGSEIMAFVSSVLDSIGAIVKGNIGAVAGKVEDSLARALPLAISFLASLLGLGGISDKVRSVIQKVQAPINKAVDFVVMGAVKGAKKLFGWAKGKAKGAKDWAKGKYDAAKDRITGKDKDKAQGPDAAGTEPAAEGADVKREAGIELRKRAAGPLATVEALREILAGVLSDLRPKGLKDLKAVPKKDEPGAFDVLATASPTEKVGEADVPAEADAELALLDDGVTPLEERRTLLAESRALLNNEDAMGNILETIRAGRMKKANAVALLRRIVSENLSGGYRLESSEKVQPGYGRRFDMHYFGLYVESIPKIKKVVRPRGGLPLGFAYVKPAPTKPDGSEPVPALALDLFIAPSVEAAKVKGVGSQMFKDAAAHFGTDFEAVVGEWYTMSFYASKSAGRPAMSTNLTQYLAARKRGATPEEAAMETWTGKRVNELYGGVPLDINVRELVPDIHNPPADEQIVEVTMRPK